ncbi:lasso peptide biosynthesis B2 protein [Deinococcus sp. HMF7620]|uniref:Lasso peptide biosynthesis B2 protein n=2 Tax=Deinococcus arboris TaxID=2682977 RepID=A0A7C9HRF8_9DEIO|nr:lasso peptide biosynthesis B2 protein [Deinococcus arboris]
MAPDPLAVQRALTSDPDDLQAAWLFPVRAAGLGGALRARLPQEHPWRGALRPDALALGVRHARIRAAVRGLVAVWAAAGIPALLFKGFALSEFEYATPGERFYGDVDVLLPSDEATVTRAVHLALARGWRSDGQHAWPENWTHESAHLYSPDGQVRLDIHRFVLSTAYVPVSRSVQLTTGLWQRARAVDWEGVPVLRPSPADELVLTLALGRCWGGDLGGLKPADYLDLACLLPHGPSEETLTAHAAQLGAAHTWAAFRRLCDPARRTLELRPAQTRAEVVPAAAHDGVQSRPHPWRKVRRAWTLAPHLAAALPDVLRAAAAVRRGGDPRTHLAGWTPPVTVQTRLHGPQLDGPVSAARLLTHWLHPRQRRDGVCVPRAYATYQALRRLGHPAVFVSGVARSGAGVTGHAWIEDDRGTLELYGEPFNRQHFQVLFETPASPERTSER